MYQVVRLAVILAMTVSAAPAQRLTPAQYARAGWEAIDAGKFREAADAFTEALRGAPQEPTVTLGAGVAAHRLGQSDTARRYFLDTLRLDPKMTPASVLLGDVLDRAGDIRGAIQVYEQGLVHAPAPLGARSAVVTSSRR